MPDLNQQFVSITETASYLGVAIKTLRRWEKRGVLLPTKTTGGHRRYLISQIAAFKKGKGKRRITENLLQKTALITRTPSLTEVKLENIKQAPAILPQPQIPVWEIKYPPQTQLRTAEDIRQLYSHLPQTSKRMVFLTVSLLILVSSSIFLVRTQSEPLKLAKKQISALFPQFFLRSPERDNLALKKAAQLKVDILSGEVLAATSFQNVNFSVNVKSLFRDLATFDSDVEIAGNTGIGGNLTVEGTSNDIAGTLNLSGNILTSTGDLTLDPTGGGVKVGTGTAGSVDLTGDDLYVTGDLEVDGTSYIPTLSINSDNFTDLTGTGLKISSGKLEAELGTSIDSSEISNDEIKEEDLKVSNSPTNAYTLTYNSSTGGFTWVDPSAAGAWIDDGTLVRLNTSTDNVTVGSATALAKLGVDGDTDEIQLLVQGNSTQTSNLAVFENSSGTDILSLTNSGTLTLIDGGFLDLSAIVHDDSALQGLRLPQAASFTSPTSGEGFIAWDSDDNNLLVYNGTAWANVGGAFTLTADSGTNQTLNAGDTITLSGGTNGIDTVVGATDTVTFNFDSTEVGTTTWNAGASDPVWTFNTSGATDPTLTFANNQITIGSAATLTATDVTAFNCTDCIDFDDMADSMSVDAATDINLGTNALTIDLDSTGDFSIRDVTTDIATFADSGAITFAPTSGTNFAVTAAGAGAVNVTTATGSQTHASSVATTSTTSSAWVFTDNSLTSGTGGYVNSSSITQGNLFQVATATGADTLTSGNLLRVSSDLANSTFTGNLASIDWSPDGTTEIFNTSADLLEINAGQYANVGYLLNVSDNSSSVFTVSQTAITSALPHSFTAAGDVSIAYDLVFTNQTASYIKSSAPLYLQAGESFESNNLTLQVYNAGSIVLDGSTSVNTGTGGVLDLNVNSTTANNVGFREDYTVDTGVTAANDLFAGQINLQQNDADADLYGLFLNLNSTSVTIAGTNLLECFLCLENDENQAAAVANAIWITSTAATAGSITNGINFDTTDIGDDIVLQNDETINNDTNGTVLIEDGGTTTLISMSTTAFSINLDDTTSRTERLCHGGGDLGTGVAAVSDCSGTPGDYAEEYGTSDPTIGPGDLVITDPAKPAIEIEKDGLKGSKAWISKSFKPYQTDVIGVVSTQPNDIIGRNFAPSENPWPITLSGRVPVKVTTENGEIKVGDPLTSSLIPGVAMKATQAGQIVAKALENYNQAGVGKIISFINISWFDPELAFNATGDLILPDQNTSQVSQTTTEDHTATGSAELTLNIGEKVTLEQVKQLVDEALADRELLESAKNWDISTATSSAELALSNLYVTENAAAKFLSVTDLVVVGSDLVISSAVNDEQRTINSIDTLYSPLELQSAAAQPVRFMAGLVQIDTQGNMIVGGDLTVVGSLRTRNAEIAELKTQKLILQTDAQQSASSSATPSVILSNTKTTNSAGRARIAQGETQTTIESTAVTADSLIYLTPLSTTTNQVLYVKEQADGVFTAGFDAPVETGVTFNWWVVELAASP